MLLAIIYRGYLYCSFDSWWLYEE